MKFSKNNNRINSKLSIKFSQLIFLLLTVAVFGSAYAQLELKKHTINSGGTTMAGGGFELKSSIGQVDVSKPSSGGNYKLNGGFWQQNSDLIFKNKFQ